MCGRLFLEGKWGGQLHAAIAQDDNDDIYPIAYAVCEIETKDLLKDVGYLHERHM
jgi:hypothetical protein